MPRNGSGTYTLPEPPFVPNTPIASGPMNSDLSDIGVALTASLPRDGQGAMTAVLPLANDGFAYAADPDTGMSRSAANTQKITCGGSDWTFTSTSLTAPDGTGIGPLIGEVRMWMLPTAPAGWVLVQGQVCSSSYPLQRAALIAVGSPYGTSGSDPLFPDMRCRIPAGRDTILGILTGATVLGAQLGTQDVTLSTTQMPAHTHPLAIDSGGVDHTNPVFEPTGNVGTAAGAQPAAGPRAASNTGNASSYLHNHTGSATATGGSQSHMNVQPTIVLNFITRAA